jgi:acyl-CoA synthetase (AMP-forming)/AMP-acid ligase II
MEISLGEAITMTARNKPDAPSFAFADGSAHTFAQTNARVNRLVSALKAQGVGRGDRLAVFSLDSHRYVEIVLAALKLGAVYVPLNYRLRRGEIDTLVKRAEPVVFCYDARYTELLEGLAEAHQGIRLFLAMNDEYEALLAAGTEAEPPVVAGDRDAFGAGTEAGLQAVLTPEDHRAALDGRPELLGSIGKPAYGVALRIVDDDLNEVPVGEIGEIATRSDMVMDGYLEMPEETGRALRGGWFRAGDMGYLDANGYLYLGGRKKDMIVRGGENIYPIEIESVLADHPAVAQSAVVGVPDEHWSEIVRAWVTLRPGAAVTAEELAAHCGQRLATYKVPAEFRFADELPVNASGKILKRELRTWE